MRRYPKIASPLSAPALTCLSMGTLLRELAIRLFSTVLILTGSIRVAVVLPAISDRRTRRTSPLCWLSFAVSLMRLIKLTAKLSQQSGEVLRVLRSEIAGSTTATRILPVNINTVENSRIANSLSKVPIDKHVNAGADKGDAIFG